MGTPSFEPESEGVQRVTVRLLIDTERCEFDRLIEVKHSRHDSTGAGQTLRYVAELDGQWVALVTFSAASLDLKARERWIGWSARQRARRLALVVNHSRLLVLAERQRYPNLASPSAGALPAAAEPGRGRTLGASGVAGREFRR